MAYEDFIAGKRPQALAVGIEADERDFGHGLFEYQSHCAAFALRQGRAGLFLDTGLGKSAIELAFVQRAAEASNGRGLILAPLAVGWQMAREAEKFGYPATVIREQSQARDGINICNYERLSKIEPDAFGAVALDEASIIKAFTGKTTAALMAAFLGHRFKLSATATPAPNDHMELGQQAQFLEVMASNEMLMRWFTADQTQMGRYRLKGHGERDFWDWMASWARMAENPEDMGFDGSRFVLPPLDVVYHRALAEVKPMEGSLFAGAASATEIHDVKRQTAEARAELAGELADADGACVVWCDTDYEADALRACMPDAIEVRGSMTIEAKEEALEAFATGQAPKLITKPSICGYGLNWQHCNRMIFAGRTFSYEAWYQAVRRCWRFGQVNPVTAHVIVAQGEDQIATVIDRKSDDHKRMKRAMREAMRRATGQERAGLREYNPTHNGHLPTWLSAA